MSDGRGCIHGSQTITVQISIPLRLARSSDSVHSTCCNKRPVYAIFESQVHNMKIQVRARFKGSYVQEAASRVVVYSGSLPVTNTYHSRRQKRRISIPLLSVSTIHLLVALARLRLVLI